MNGNITHTYISTYREQYPLSQWTPTFLVPGTSFVEDNFSTDWVCGTGVQSSGGNASEASLAFLLLTSCCAAQVLMGHGPVPVCGWEIEDPCPIVLLYPLGTGSNVHFSLLPHPTKVHSYFSVFLEHLLSTPSHTKNLCTIVFVLGLGGENLSSPFRVKQPKAMDCVLLFLCPSQHLPQHCIRRCPANVG